MLEILKSRFPGMNNARTRGLLVLVRVALKFYQSIIENS